MSTIITAAEASATITSLSQEVEALKADVAQALSLLGDEKVRAEAAEAELDSLKEQLGLVRMCVNCGRTADASKVKRGDKLPECVGPEGLSACTFDLTPQEAYQHWRDVAHKRREDVSRLTAERDAALERVKVLEKVSGLAGKTPWPTALSHKEG